ncbi:MAG: PEP-CTERM sorting domain-containing protein [Isosphaeraceae bacterium]
MKASNRMRIGPAVVAAFAVLAIALGNSAAVRADAEIAAFQSSSPSGAYTYTGGSLPSGPSTLSTTVTPNPGQITLFSPFVAANQTLGGTISLSASSTTAATGVILGGQFFGSQNGFTGSLTLTNTSGHTVDGVGNNQNFLTVTFSSASLSESGGAATLQGSATIAVNPLLQAASITQPETFSLSLTGLSASGLGAFGFSNFTGNDSGNASATIESIASVPEPSTMAIAGLGALGLIGYGLRRRKALGD